jgi:hypothetical protein
VLFWIGVIVMELEDADLYTHALLLIERTLRTMEAQSMFDFEVKIRGGGSSC